MANSTIDPTKPSNISGISSAVIRSNFLAAYNDITGLLTGSQSIDRASFQLNNVKGFTFDPRLAVATMPVPTLRPSTANSCLAFDLMPNGTVTIDPFGGDLITWIDICSHDIYSSFSGTNTLLGLRNRQSVLEITSQIGGGATLKPIVFSLGASEIYRINSTGLGIGTGSNAFGSKLTVSNNGAPLPTAYPTVAQFGGADAIAARNLINSFGGQAIISLQRADGTGATPTALLNAEPFGQVEFGGYVGSNGYNITASVLGVTEEAWSNTAQGSALSVYTTQKTTNTIRETARFAGSGGFSVGTTSDPGFGLMYLNSASFLMRNKTSWSNGAAAAAGTLTNAPAAGNPTKWIPIDDNGTTRYIPAW